MVILSLINGFVLLLLCIGHLIPPKGFGWFGYAMMLWALLNLVAVIVYGPTQFLTFSTYSCGATWLLSAILHVPIIR